MVFECMPTSTAAGDLINALFQSDQQSLVGFAEADLLSGSPTYAKELSNRIKA